MGEYYCLVQIIKSNCCLWYEILCAAS